MEESFRAILQFRPTKQNLAAKLEPLETALKRNIAYYILNFLESEPARYLCCGVTKILNTYPHQPVIMDIEPLALHKPMHLVCALIIRK